ncbi:MAG: calcium-binding protein, partial [Pseudomonadota bacterium]
VVLDASGGDDQNGFVVTGPVRVDARDFENVVGTDFDDKVRGSKEDNILSGGDGADTLRGLRGDDTIVGNKGDDRMIGGAGDDLLVWNNGDGSDLMKGGRGDDRTQVNFDTDLVNDDLQNDDTARIESAGQNFRFARTEVNGQSERGLFELDIRFVETLEVNFGGGDDTAELVGVPSRRLTTELDGGEGEDTLDLSDVERAAVVDIGAGLASVERGGDVVFEGFENVIGTDFADEIVGDGGANLIASGSANDEIEGGDGDDTLLGNLGDDEVFGGEGDDLLIWNNGDGSDLLNGGEGDDRVQVNFQQNTDLSELDLQNDDVATIADDGEGGITFNRVEVNGQSERGLFQLDIEESETLEVNFGGGNDVAQVLGLADLNIALQLDGGDGVDTIDFSGLDLDGEEEGVVFDAASGEIETVAGDASDDVAAGFENIVGTAGDDVISGDDQDNVIEGGGGSDILSGGAGADTFVFGDEPGVTVILDFEVGQDRIAFRSESFGVEEPL